MKSCKSYLEKKRPLVVKGKDVLEKVSGEFCKAYFLQVYCSVFLCAEECRSLPPWLYQSVTNHCLRLHKITHIVSKIFNIFRSHIKPLVHHWWLMLKSLSKILCWGQQTAVLGHG